MSVWQRPSTRLSMVGRKPCASHVSFDRGCENVAVPGVDSFGVERVKHIDGRVRRVPGRDDKDLRLQCANIPVAIGIEAALMVSGGDTDRASRFGGGRFGVAPRIAAVVGVVGEIAAGVVAEFSIAETNGAGAGILRGVVGRLESCYFWEELSCLLALAGPDLAVGNQVAYLKAGIVGRFVLQGELVFGSGAKTLDSFASLDLRLKERAIVLLEIDISKHWIGVVRPGAVNEPLDRDDGGHVGNACKTVSAVG